MEFTGGLRRSRFGWEQEISDEGGREEDSIRRDYWNWVAFWGQCRNLVPWRLCGIFEGDPNKDA